MVRRVEWGGKKWWINSRGYWMSRTGEMLHRAVYAATYGPIPKGIHIHHRDGDRLNFDVGNLEALTPGGHYRSHPPRGWDAHGDSETRARRMREVWNRAVPHDVICGFCGSLDRK